MEKGRMKEVLESGGGGGEVATFYGRGSSR
jgi:hypothetical protein